MFIYIKIINLFYSFVLFYAILLKHLPDTCHFLCRIMTKVVGWIRAPSFRPTCFRPTFYVQSIRLGLDENRLDEKWVYRCTYIQRNLIKSNQNQIVFAILRLIWIQTDVRLDPNQPENGKYNPITVRIKKISKSLLCVIKLSY